MFKFGPGPLTLSQTKKILIAALNQEWLTHLPVLANLGRWVAKLIWEMGGEVD